MLSQTHTPIEARGFVCHGSHVHISHGGAARRGEAEAGGWGRGEAGLGARRGVHRLKLYPGIQPIAFVFVVAGSLFLDLASFLQWSEDMPGMSVACARSCIRVRVCQNL